MTTAALFERVSWPVRTPRLTIRPAAADDLPRLYEIRSAPGVSEWLTASATSYDEFLALQGTPERLACTLVVEHEGGIVGDLYLAVDSPWSQREVRDEAAQTRGEIGWCIDPSYAVQTPRGHCRSSRSSGSVPGALASASTWARTAR